MQATTETNGTEISKSAARGLGRYYRRLGLTEDIAVGAAGKAYPGINEEWVAAGWRAERAGR